MVYNASCETLHSKDLSMPLHVLILVLHLLKWIASGTVALGRRDIMPKSEGGASIPTAELPSSIIFRHSFNLNQLWLFITSWSLPVTTVVQR
jgi:hypothetical protein